MFFESLYTARNDFDPPLAQVAFPTFPDPSLCDQPPSNIGPSPPGSDQPPSPGVPSLGMASSFLSSSLLSVLPSSLSNLTSSLTLALHAPLEAHVDGSSAILFPAPAETCVDRSSLVSPAPALSCPGGILDKSRRCTDMGSEVQANPSAYIS
jgi:hypothetical protein